MGVYLAFTTAKNGKLANYYLYLHNSGTINLHLSFYICF